MGFNLKGEMRVKVKLGWGKIEDPGSGFQQLSKLFNYSASESKSRQFDISRDFFTSSK